MMYKGCIKHCKEAMQGIDQKVIIWIVLKPAKERIMQAGRSFSSCRLSAQDNGRVSTKHKMAISSVLLCFFQEGLSWRKTVLGPLLLLYLQGLNKSITAVGSVFAVVLLTLSRFVQKEDCIWLSHLEDLYKQQHHCSSWHSFARC